MVTLYRVKLGVGEGEARQVVPQGLEQLDCGRAGAFGRNGHQLCIRMDEGGHGVHPPQL